MSVGVFVLNECFSQTRVMSQSCHLELARYLSCAVCCGMRARAHRQTPVCVIPLVVIRRWLLAPGFNSFN